MSVVIDNLGKKFASTRVITQTDLQTTRKHGL